MIAERDFIKMPITELTTYAPGRRCMAPAWWVVTEDRCVLFFKHYYSPQCNQNRAIVERIMRHKNASIEFIPQAFVPHSCSDYA